MSITHNMESFLGSQSEQHEAARLVAGMEFLVMLKEAMPSMGGKFSPATKGMLNTSLGSMKQSFGKPPALAGTTAKALKGRIPKFKKTAEQTKEAFFAETLRAIANGGHAIGNSVRGDLHNITESVHGYREGLAGDHGVDFLNRPVKPGIIDSTGNWWSRHNNLSVKPEHLDPTQANGRWARFKTRFAPDVNSRLKPEERLELKLKNEMRSVHAAHQAAGRNVDIRDVTSPEISRLKNHLNSFKRGQAVAQGIGTPALIDQLKHTMTNADGHVSPLSVLHGAGQMGWLDKDVAKRALEQSVGRISGASQEAAQAEKRKHMLMLGGGIAGGVVGGGLLAKGMQDK